MLFFRSMPWYFIGCCLYHCLGCFLGYCSVYYLNYCQFVSHLVVLEAERLFSLVYYPTLYRAKIQTQTSNPLYPLCIGELFVMSSSSSVCSFTGRELGWAAAAIITNVFKWISHGHRSRIPLNISKSYSSINLEWVFPFFANFKHYTSYQWKKDYISFNSKGLMSWTHTPRSKTNQSLALYEVKQVFFKWVWWLKKFKQHQQYH